MLVNQYFQEFDAFTLLADTKSGNEKLVTNSGKSALGLTYVFREYQSYQSGFGIASKMLLNYSGYFGEDTYNLNSKPAKHDGCCSKRKLSVQTFKLLPFKMYCSKQKRYGLQGWRVDQFKFTRSPKYEDNAPNISQAR